ncbi:MAG TPA: hypothetical protein VLD63_00825 [Anaerolineales bacterium]|nr:hypothetical protein [Anaerolineales bacterium]
MVNSAKQPKSLEPGRSALGRRLAEARDRQESQLRSAARGASRSARSWDPALAAGLSPGLMMVALVVSGVGVALLLFSGVQAARSAENAQAAGSAESEAAFVQPKVEVAAPNAPNPARAIEDYYVLLRQSMYDVAWSRTTSEFQQENYPAGYPAYVQAWSGMAELEVLSSGVTWQDETEASVWAELRDTATDHLFKNAYRMRYNPDSGLWSIISITTVW